jgi:error-prone DNA polymerase
MFSHLNVHSIYSKMSGTAAPELLVAQAKQNRMSHLALTEVNGLWGFIRFVQTAREQDILPIAGTNLITETDEAILLAETQKGYENICFILSKIHDDPAADIRHLFDSHSEELFVLAHREKTLNELSSIIPASHLFVELRPGIEERYSHKLAHLFSLEMVATSDVYFLHPEDAQTHKILRAIDKNATLSQLTPEEIKDRRHYFRTEKEMISLFPNSLDAINNSQYLAERCKTDWNYINTIFPEMSLKDTHRASRKLREQVYQGAKIRYLGLTPPIRKRIEYELTIITQKGYAPYFLIVADIVSQTPATIGRGSGAASVVSYCLFITQVDPIKYNLQFERFIHPERTDMPDIDIDFPWDERDDILKYVFEKYGKERTAMVSSQVFLQPRSAIREVAKVYGFSNEEINAITKRIGYFQGRVDLLAWINSDNRFKNLDLNDALVEVITQSEKIMGAFRYSSVHPGGVIIVPDDIRKYVPVLMAPKGVQIVEWEKDQVEDSGLLKIDLLGNRSLAVVRDTLNQIARNDGKQESGNNQYMDYHQIQPVDDSKTERLLKTGRTMGVFYIESPATRLLLRKARVADFEHVVIYSSIIRPAANRYIDLMLERIHGKAWKLLHPNLKCLLESYGIMVYEEQVSKIARDISGFGYFESDYLRKVISKPSLIHKIPYWRRKFINGAVKRGYSKALMEKLWEMIQSFSGYSFCKPHSASYAMLSFTCAYLKAHHPAELGYPNSDSRYQFERHRI